MLESILDLFFQDSDFLDLAFGLLWCVYFTFDFLVVAITQFARS